MSDWILKIELNGEWEECRFETQREALDAFAALSADYQVGIARAAIFTASAITLPRPWPALRMTNNSAYVH